MRTNTIVMVGFAVVFGVLAVFIAQIWLNGQANKRAHNITAQKPLPTQTVVVAAKTLRFGTELTPALLREQPWPAKAVPPGAFSKIRDILTGGRRVVLSAISKDEPILAIKITGPGQRATLSALVKPGMKAVTIRVNDVDGVGGFVLPGDHVDILLARRVAKGSATTQVVLQDIKVLAIDQTADDRTTRAKVAKSVTLQVTTVEAQKLWLASSIGSLSLLLRQAGDTSTLKTRLISLKDLVSNGKDLVSNGIGAHDFARTTTVVVIRPKAQQSYTVPVEQSYTVPVEGSSGASTGTTERRQAGS